MSAMNKTVNNFEDKLGKLDMCICECSRMSYLADNSHFILNDIDKDFEEKTKLTTVDQCFLWSIAVPAQLTRIWLINYLTQIQDAGQSMLESKLKEYQGKLFNQFDQGEYCLGSDYFASKNQILVTDGVPYDACNYSDINYHLLKGGHRVSTLGHNPVLGLIFGTGNIMTNTITCCSDGFFCEKLGLQNITTNHVIYCDGYRKPLIGPFGFTSVMLYKMIDRTIEEPEVFVASFIKQIIHIGTDMYTPMGIQLPFIDLLLNKKQVAEITKIVGFGDYFKIKTQASVAIFINMLVSLFHTLLYDNRIDYSRSLYQCRTNRLIDVSNAIASLTNAAFVTGNCMNGNIVAVKKLDFGGLMALTYRLRVDEHFRNELKRQYVTEKFNSLIRGEDFYFE